MNTDDATHASATDPAEVLANLGGRVLYHGTSKRNARRILREGFRDWSWTATTPHLKYKAEQGLARWLHDGSYGRGTYVSCNWRAALHFGPVLFRVELQPGTRILRLDIPPSPKVLDSLKREFGKEILKASPWKVLPRNKRLTLDEAIQLARHHVRNSENNWARSRGPCPHEKLMFDLRNILVRYGIQGWGEPADIAGIVIFAADRIRVREVLLAMPTEDAWYDCRNLASTLESRSSLDALIRSTRAARNRGAPNTLAWVDASNAAIQEARRRE